MPQQKSPCQLNTMEIHCCLVLLAIAMCQVYGDKAHPSGITPDKEITGEISLEPFGNDGHGPYHVRPYKNKNTDKYQKPDFCALVCTCDYSEGGQSLTIRCSFDPGDSLYDVISKYPLLQYLTISISHLSKFDCIVEVLSELVVLDLKGNNLVEVPTNCIRHHKYLQMLDLSYNEITTLRNQTFYDATALWSINLSANKISVIEPDVFLQAHRLPVLDNLDLSHNNLTSLDSWPLALASNKEYFSVAINGNLISKLTDNFARSPHSCKQLQPITSIGFNDNKITHFTDVFTGWNLDVHKTEELKECIDRTEFDLTNNPLVCDCVDYEVYKYLHNSPPKHGYEGLTCSQPSNLKGWDPVQVDLGQFACNISDDCPPGCGCLSNPHAEKVIINCLSYNETSLPDILPELPTEDVSYQIGLGQNNLISLSDREYLNKTFVAIFSHNAIKDVAIDALTSLQNARSLYLDNNELERLPDGIRDIKLPFIEGLRLGGNPWICDCGSMDMIRWMKVYANHIEDADQVQCANIVGTNIIATDVRLFCEENDNRIYIIIGACLGAVFLIVCMGMVCFSRNKIWIYKKTNWHPMERDECEGENKVFDIFVSYSSEDEEYAGEWLIPELERRGFKVCFHRVHFLGGKPITVNICECIDRSKRTLVFFSPEFKISGFCMWEFYVALELDLQHGTKRLITIKDTDLNMDEQEITVRTYFKSASYICRESPRFWDNLLYTLPVNRMGEVQEDQNA